MNVREIVAAHLRDNHYTGLAGDNCWCGLDDLMPCDTPDRGCRAGHSHVARDGEFEGHEVCVPGRHDCCMQCNGMKVEGDR